MSNIGAVVKGYVFGTNVDNNKGINDISLGLINSYGFSLATVTAITPIINLPLKTSLSTGTTFTRASTATLVDFEGLVKTAKVGETRFEGARRVENFVEYSEDLTNPIWQVGGSMVVDSATHLSMPDVSAFLRHDTSIGAGNIVRQIKMSGSGTIGIAIYNPTDNYIAKLKINLTSTPTLYTLSAIATVPNSRLYIGRFHYFMPDNIPGTATGVEIEYQQFENVTGQANQNPSEYVSNGAEIAGQEDKVINGSFDTDTDWTKNVGWTISGGRAIHTGAGDYITQNTVVSGLDYFVTVDVAVADGSNFPQLYMGGLTTAMTSPGIHTFVITATSDEVKLRGLNDCEVNSIKVTQLTHGANVDGVKYFNTENGNTVVSNVVTEATGTAIAETTLKGALLEKEATNLFRYSTDISNGSWIKASSSVNSNIGFSPFPNENLSAIIPNSGTYTYSYINQSYAKDVNTIYTLSCYVEKGDFDWVMLSLDSFSNNRIAWFNVSLGTKGTLGANAINSTITPFYNGYIISLTSTGSSATYDIITPTNGDNSSVITGDGVKQQPIGRLQLEVDKIQTSYIPTSASTVTRIADDLTNTNINFPTTDISVLMSITPIADGTEYGNFRIWSTSDSRGSLNELTITHNPNYLYIQQANGGGFFTINKGDFLKDVTYKLGFSLKQEGSNVRAIIVKDGVEVYNALIAGTLNHSNLQKLQVGRWDSAGADKYASADYKNVEVYNTALTSEELQGKQFNPLVDEGGNNIVDELGNIIGDIN